MTFLCSHHRRQLANDLDFARKRWYQLVYQARTQIGLQQWEAAVTLYGNALEVAELSLADVNKARATERFLQTAVEMLHALRNSEYRVDTHALYQHAVNIVHQRVPKLATDNTLQPLTDVTFEPLSRVNAWMQHWHNLLQPNASARQLQ